MEVGWACAMGQSVTGEAHAVIRTLPPVPPPPKGLLPPHPAHCAHRLPASESCPHLATRTGTAVRMSCSREQARCCCEERLERVGVCPRTCACLCACVRCGCSCTPVYAQACIPPCNSMPVHTRVLPVGQSRDKRLLRTPFGELCPSCDSEGSCTPRVSVKGHFYLPV